MSTGGETSIVLHLLVFALCQMSVQSEMKSKKEGEREIEIFVPAASGESDFRIMLTQSKFKHIYLQN